VKTNRTVSNILVCQREIQRPFWQKSQFSKRALLPAA
jgi:hypothetical protein